MVAKTNRQPLPVNQHKSIKDRFLQHSTPTISLITTTFNSQETIAHTLESALSQTSSDFEHIIIDNLSSDSTLEIIESYRAQYTAKNIALRVFSQKDNGIYDGMNKGIAKAQGEIIGFLNADDYFSHSKVLDFILWGFSSPKNVSIVYANVMYVNNALKPLRAQKGRSYDKNAFARGFHPPHPSFYAKKSAFIDYGSFNLSYHIAADYELMLRFLHKQQLQSLYIDECLVNMRAGGASNGSLARIIKANAECLRAWGDNGLATPVFVPVFSIAYKLARKLKDRLIVIIRGGAELDFAHPAFSHFTCPAPCILFIFTNPLNSADSAHLTQGGFYAA